MAVLQRLLVGLVCYAVLTMPVAFAATVRVAYPTLSASQQPVIGLQSLVSRQITFQQAGSGWTVAIDVSGNGASLSAAFLFRCGSRSPTDCASQVSPETIPLAGGAGHLEGPFSSFVTSSSPQTGSILLVAKVPPGTWQAFWHTLSQATPFAAPTATSSDFSGEVTVQAAALSAVQSIASFVRQQNMIPMSPQLVSSVSVGGASGLHELLADSPPTFSPALTAGSQVTAIGKAYDLLLPVQGGTIQNGIPLAAASSTFCGNAVCEAGETSGSCCYDCGCIAGQYCDVSGACRPLSLALTVVPPTATTVVNCNQYNNITASLQVTNPPSDLRVTSTSALVGGQQAAFSCAPAGGGYACQLAVPPHPQCSQGSFSYTNNSVTFAVAYSDGPATKTQSLKTGLPDITVGSWTCGQNGCETGLGESQANCCVDCGCPGGSYCDLAAAAPLTSGTCRPASSATAFQISSVSPGSFPLHNAAGNVVTFRYSFPSPPASLALGKESCSVDCVGTAACLPTCTVACSPAGSGASCTLSFAISNYNSLKGYSVTPKLTVPFSYADGSTAISTAVTSSLPVTYAFGPYYCGDLTCDAPDETSANCCFDCGCQSGEYCSTASIQQASSQDACVPQQFQLQVDPLAGTSFTDHLLPHEINVTARLSPMPAGFSLVSQTCTLAGGSIPCTLACAPLASSPTSYHFSCSLTVPPIVYQGSSLFDPQAKTLKLSGNSLNLTIAYNSGPSRSTAAPAAALPDLSIMAVPHCGVDGCEAVLGETQGSCCVDCGCATGSVCVPGGGDPASVCAASSSIQAFVAEVQNPPVCEIRSPAGGGDCVFVQATTFIINVTNAPADLKIADYVMSYGGNATSVKTNCVQLSRDSSKCSIPFKTIKGASVFGGGNLTPQNISTNATFTLTASYLRNGTQVTPTLTAFRAFTLEMKKSDELLSCEEQDAQLSFNINKFSSKRDLIWTIFGILLGVTAGHCICCGISPCAAAYSLACPICNWGIIVTSCVGAALLPAIGQMQQEADELKVQKRAICAARTSNDLENAVDSTGQIGYTIGGIVLGAICAAAIGGAIQGGGTLASPLGIGTGSGGTAAGAAAGSAATAPAVTAPTVTAPTVTAPAI